MLKYFQLNLYMFAVNVLGMYLFQQTQNDISLESFIRFKVQNIAHQRIYFFTWFFLSLYCHHTESVCMQIKLNEFLMIFFPNFKQKKI